MASRDAATTTAIAARPAGIVAPSRGTRPAPAAIRTSTRATCTACRARSAIATQPCRSAPWSGTVSALLTANTISPPQATASPAISVSS